MGIRREETAIQLEAYNFYFLLGDKRKLDDVAQHFNRSLPLIRLWSSKHNWKSRVQEQEASVYKEERLSIEKELSGAKNELKELIADLIKQFKKQFDAGNVQANSISDLERVTKLYLLLTGEATEVEPKKIIFMDYVADENGNPVLSDEKPVKEKKVIEFPKKFS